MRALSAALKEMERKATSEQKKTKKRIRRRDDSDSEEPTMSIGLCVDPVIANPEDSDDEDDTDSDDEDDTDSVRQMLSDEDEDDTDSVRQMLYDKVTYPGVVLVQAYEAGACAGKSLMTWDDFDPGKRPSYYLYKIEDIDEIDELGRDVFNKLRKNASERCICQLMLLAYNLKDAEGHDVFGDIPHQLLDINWKDFSEISGSPLLTGRSRFHINAIPKGNNREDVRERSIGYCYLAASYLRMYTKSAENFALIADHLRKRFPDLYAFEFPFSSFHPDGKTVKRVKTVFETNSRLRNTFYNLIYAGEICPNGRDLKDFLYVTHISYTGLHSYMLFLKCMSAYNVNSAELENFLRTNRFKSELDALSTIFTDFFNGGKGKKAKMWRFARIFNSSFMKQLQTKKCLLFTCTLAYLYNMAGMSQTQNQNVLNIAQIKDAPEGVKRKAKSVAMIVRRHLLEKAASASHHPQVLKKVKRR